ncbi:MAG: HPP family protein [Desulfovibrionaceae bacterium]
MIQIRLRPLCRREFEKDVYRPGVISLSRLIWGSLGGGLTLAVIALLSRASGVGVLYPPLAATCFINATCVYLRVARPRQVIVGHLVSSAAGVLAVIVGNALAPQLTATMTVALKLGLAVTLAAVFMQVFDADHPPAAATAAIPAILPLPVEPLLLPLHMAWGGVVAVLCALAWNRFWFSYPAPEGENCPMCMGLHQGRAETLGLGVCVLAATLMGLRPLSQALYQAGLWAMLLGAAVLMFQHFFDARLVVAGEPRKA